VRLIILEKSGSRTLAYVTDPDAPEGVSIIAFLRNRPGDQEASARGFKSLFKRYVELGRQGLTVELFHEADAKEAIWEFIKGRLRCFCFMDNPEHLTILTHGVVKKTPKANRQEVATAVAIKKRYLAAKAEGTLTIMRSEHE